MLIEPGMKAKILQKGVVYTGQVIEADPVLITVRITFQNQTFVAPVRRNEITSAFWRDGK